MTMLAPPPPPVLTTVRPSPPASKASPHVSAGQRVLLPHISWATYRAMLADVGDGAARLTYDNGWLEIVMPGRTHELVGRFVGELVTTTLKHQRIAYEPSGATTWRREDLHRGLEADECYHVQTVARLAGKLELDLAVDPPPDLAIEVEVESPLLDKAAVYAGLGVPELWRVRADGECDFYRLDTAGAYQPAAVSTAAPPLTPSVVTHYLRLRLELSHSAALVRFAAEYLPTVSVGP